MSSSIKKMQDRIELKRENAWLKNAFRKAWGAAVEQSDNAMELTKVLIIALQKNGPVTVTKADLEALSPNAKLQGATNTETGETIYSTYDAETVIESDGETAIAQVPQGE